MQKSIIAALIIGLAASAAGAREATTLKNIYLAATKTNTVQLTAAQVAWLCGDQQTLDMCIAAGWDASAIANGLQGRKITPKLVAVCSSLPRDEWCAFAVSVAQGLSKVQGVNILCAIPPALLDPAACAAVLAVQDGSETNLARMKTLGTYACALSIERGQIVNYNKIGLGDMVAWLLGGDTLKASVHVAIVKERVKLLAQPLIKRALRAKGQTFVAHDGINPIEEAMKPVVAALNAPKLAGLEAALRGLGADIPDIERSDAIWGPIVAEKDAVMNGDKPAHPSADGGIILLLGPDGYNRWVAEYNNGKK